MKTAGNSLKLSLIIGAALVSLIGLDSSNSFRGQVYAQNSNIEAKDNSNRARATKRRKLSRQDRRYAAKRPDLIITQAEAIDGQNLRVRVVNAGTMASSGCELVMFYHRGGNIVERGKPVPALGAGGGYWMEISAFGSALEAASKITLLVDYQNVVSESNESNNNYIFKE